MTKIHTLTSKTCIVCDECISIQDNECIDYNQCEECETRGYIIHKTRRQTHAMCEACYTSYLKPYIDTCKRLLKRGIYQDMHNYMIKCPGTYSSSLRNRCQHNVRLFSLVPPSNLINDVFLISVHAVFKQRIPMCVSNECDKFGVVTSDTNMVTCTHCPTTWCRLCMESPYHTDSECSSTYTPYVKSEIEKGNIKDCPLCGTLTEKARVASTGSFVSCNKMRCIVCSITWCWLCKEVDVDYSHYNEKSNTSCSNKLWKGVDLKMYE